jgi:general secretion pathway protein D
MGASVSRSDNLPSAGSQHGYRKDSQGSISGLRRFRWVIAAALTGCALLLASCNTPSALLENPTQVDLTPKTPRKLTNRNEGPVLKTQAQGARYEVFPGVNSPLTDDGGEPPPGVGAQNDGKFTVNVDQAGLAEAAKLILGETLGYNYTLDPRVQGSITLVSNRPLSARELLSAFEASLRLSGAALIQSDGSFKVVALQEVLDGEMGTADMGQRISPGFGVNAIPLRYVSPNNLMELLDSFIARSGSVRASKVGNMILVRGPAEERRALVEVILSFDVDWMKTQTASVATLDNGRAEDLAAKIEQIFAEDTAASGPNALKVIPVPSINGLIIIANDQGKVRRAINWVRRLDRESVNAPNYYVYAVQNGNSVELAKILNATFGTGGADAGATAEVAPNTESMAVSMEGSSSDQQGSSAPPPPPGTEGAPQNGQSTSDGGLTTGTTGQEGGDQFTSFNTGGGTRITPNPANNTIVIRATPKEYRKILATLRQIDAPATQVLITATIAEVSLNDQLRYGVQAYFQSGNVAVALAGSQPLPNGPVISPQFPGLNFLMGGINDPELVLDALSGITKVRIVSSPSLLVLENETATIRVGDQIPIQSQTVATDGGNFVNSYEYRDTGVILKVKPRINANGVVTIDLGQELSAVLKGLPGVGDNPSFTQRSLTSKVSVNDQQTVLLGGLIAGTEDGSRTSVPGADKVPVLGNLIGTTDNTAKRTELIVLITPKIIRDGQDAARESQELRNKMKNLNFN